MSAGGLAPVRRPSTAGVTFSERALETPASNPPVVSATFWSRHLKRPADRILGILALIVLSPVLLLVAVLVKATSAGPVFFRQDRVGFGGRVFQPLKFRTMRGSRTPDAKELVPLAHPDITPLGWFLRRFKIDELPQILNVVRGEMSIVGPRPTLPDQVAAYDDFRRQRLLVYPGLTGLAQVNGNAAMPWDERILYDIAYVRRCSFWLDASILLRTLLVMLLGEERTSRPFEKSPYAGFVDRPLGFRSS